MKDTKLWMKGIIFFILMGFSLMSMAQDRIMLIADPHVFPQTLIEQQEDFEEYMEKQRKMIDLSQPLWDALMDTALAKQPSLILIPGDLTKDGEALSHAHVAASLQALRAQGIPSLVIPGNHDLPDANWESLYFGENDVYVKDPNSHSYATQPLQGVTVIGIDGTDGSAGTGKLSKSSLAWVLAQADTAVANGHTIIAMCHWQILEHFDKQGDLESACRMANADALRDSLMAHGVHLVLTGHFHVNGITTFRDTTGLTNDSIVEITTGSPITYPCPYRWLTLSADRATMEVTTDFITSVDTIADLNTYSRDWMAEHTRNMIPALARKAWGKVDDKWDSKVVPALSAVGMGYLAPALKLLLPKTDEQRTALVQEHFGNAAVSMYLFHSEANENEHPERGQALADSVYQGIRNMMTDVFGGYEVVGMLLAPVAQQMAYEPVQSLVEDKTMRYSDYADVTNDLVGTFTLNAPQTFTGITNSDTPVTNNKFLRNGQLFIIRNGVEYSVYGQRVTSNHE